MNKRIVYTENGVVKIIIPAPNGHKSIEVISPDNEVTYIKETDQEFLDRLKTELVPAGITSRITDASNIPADRTYREAWTDENTGETIDIDPVKAVAVDRKNTIAELSVLDSVVNRAQEDLFTSTNTTPQGKAADVIAQKAVLRGKL